MILNPALTKSSRKQTTFIKKVSLSGIGIHTGNVVDMTFCPAQEGTGIVFKRMDLPGQPVVPATIEYVQDTSRSTTIGIGNVRIHTIEHIMAALKAFQVDNALIEVSAAEPPVGDGSSSPFVEMILKAGVKELDATIPIIHIEQPVYWSHGKIHLVAIPSDEYRISYTLHYPATAALKTQYCTVEVNSENFVQEISPCRTFSLYHEVAYLMDKGLIKGGSLENAVVIKDDVIFSKEGLKFPDEMVRHKVLDLIGDLALVGFPVMAHVIAICSGHFSNVAFAKVLFNHITMENN
ncbi:MAG: UDP-3-O-acyl-N-acetylglucosamine deacetylase [Parachlamydiales bacterium]|nr:UDP-3-O-acyl-N-acetylglucosamine deacetylase [Parachlamydiales bacterium]